MRVDRGFAQLETAGGRRAVAIEPGIDIAAGDWVAVDDVAITAVAPRWSMLARRDPGERVEAQAVAANMDLVLLAHPLDRPFRPRRLERELVLVWESGATPVAVLTKADLGDDPDRDHRRGGRGGARRGRDRRRARPTATVSTRCGHASVLA